MDEKEKKNAEKAERRDFETIQKEEERKRREREVIAEMSGCLEEDLPKEKAD